METGLLAQEVKEVFPELVKENQDGTLGVNYSGLIPHLIEGMKKQQEQIELLKKEVETLRNQQSKKQWARAMSYEVSANKLRRPGDTLNYFLKILLIVESSILRP